MDKDYNSENLWVSMSFCYAKSLDQSANSEAVVKAVFATKVRLHSQSSDRRSIGFVVVEREDRW